MGGLFGSKPKTPAPRPIDAPLPPNVFRLSEAAIRQVRGEGVSTRDLRIGDGPITTTPTPVDDNQAGQNFFTNLVNPTGSQRMRGIDGLIQAISGMARQGSIVQTPNITRGGESNRTGSPAGPITIGFNGAKSRVNQRGSNMPTILDSTESGE